MCGWICTWDIFIPESDLYAYGMLYKMDSLVYVFDWKLAVISVIVSLLCSIGTNLCVCPPRTDGGCGRADASENTESGKRVFLEYIPFVWKRLKFLQKVSMRNIFRYKKAVFHDGRRHQRMQRTFGDRIWGEGFCDGKL